MLSSGLLASLSLVPATLVTLGGLCALLGVLWLLSRLVEKAQTPIAAPKAIQPSPINPVEAHPDTLLPDDPRLIAIVTAAATVALGRSAVVTRVTFTHHVSNSWVQFGRADIHQSHRIR